MCPVRPEICVSYPHILAGEAFAVSAVSCPVTKTTRCRHVPRHNNQCVFRYSHRKEKKKNLIENHDIKVRVILELKL